MVVIIEFQDLSTSKPLAVFKTWIKQVLVFFFFYFLYLVLYREKPWLVCFPEILDCLARITQKDHISRKHHFSPRA